MTQDKIITDAFQISGIFRAAFLRQSRVKIFCLDGTVVPGHVSDFHEVNTRSKDRDQLLTITGQVTSSVTKIELFLLENKYSFTPDYQLNQNALKVRLPQEITSSIKREKSRTRANSTVHTYAVFYSTEKSFLRSVDLLDISESGCGLLLSLEDSTKVKKGDILQLFGSNHLGSFIKRGVIKSLTASNKPEKIRAGVSFENTNKTQDSKRSVRPLRSEIRIPLTLHHPILRNLKFVAITKNSSVSGALVEILDKNVFSYIFTDMELHSEIPSLTFKVVSIDKEKSCAALKIVSGLLEDRIQWAKSVYYGDRKNGTDFYNTEDILDLLSTGAGLTKNIIEENRSLLLDRAQEDVFNEGLTNCSLKIAQLDDEGNTSALINATRTALSSWHIGGIVSKLKNQEKTKHFIKSFFRLLDDLSETIEEFSTFSISWKVNHPFWAEYEKFLVSDSSICLWAGDILRYSFSKLDIDSADINQLRLESATDAQLPEKYKNLAESLGQNKTGQKRETWKIGRKTITAERKSFTVVQNGKKIGYLLTIKLYEPISFHRNTEAAWFIPTNETATLLFADALKIGFSLAELGIFPPALIVPSSILPNDGATKVARMKYYLHDNRALKWYIEKI